jgi:VanZ family protein
MLMGWFVQLYQSRAMLVAYALFLVALGVVLEFLQGMTGRYFEVADMAANTLGVVFGLLLLFTPLRTLLQRFEARLPSSR